MHVWAKLKLGADPDVVLLGVPRGISTRWLCPLYLAVASSKPTTDYHTPRRRRKEKSGMPRLLYEESWGPNREHYAY